MIVDKFASAETDLERSYRRSPTGPGDTAKQPKRLMVVPQLAVLTASIASGILLASCVQGDRSTARTSANSVGASTTVQSLVGLPDPIGQYWPGADWPPPSPIGDQYWPTGASGSIPSPIGDQYWPTTVSPPTTSTVVRSRPTATVITVPLAESDISAIHAEVGAAIAAFERAARTPGQPDGVAEIEAATAPGSPARSLLLELYRQALASGNVRVPHPSVSNSVTVLDGPRSTVADVAVVTVCVVSVDVEQSPSGEIIDDDIAAQKMVEWFVRDDDRWLLLDLKPIESYPEVTTCPPAD